MAGIPTFKVLQFQKMYFYIIYGFKIISEFFVMLFVWRKKWGELQWV